MTNGDNRFANSAGATTTPRSAAAFRLDRSR